MVEHVDQMLDLFRHTSHCANYTVYSGYRSTKYLLTSINKFNDFVYSIKSRCMLHVVRLVKSTAEDNKV